MGGYEHVNVTSGHVGLEFIIPLVFVYVFIMMY